MLNASNPLVVDGISFYASNNALLLNQLTFVMFTQTQLNARKLSLSWILYAMTMDVNNFFWESAVGFIVELK